MLRRRNRYSRRFSIGMNDMTANDCHAVSYYLYRISETVGKEDEDTLYPAQARLFFKLADKMKKSGKISEFLSNNVKLLAEKGLLTKLQKNESEEKRPRRMSEFDYSDIAYEYEEDTDIDRQMPSSEIKIDLDTINLYRSLYASDGSDFFCQLVANFLIRKEADENFSMLEKLPAQTSKALNDFSAIKFLSDSVELSETEIKYLVFMYRCSLASPLQTLMGELPADIKNSFRSSLLGLSQREFNTLTRSSGALQSFGFIDEDGQLDEDLIECISEQSLNSFFSDLVKEADCSDAYELDSFTVSKNSTTIMQKMLSGKENISLLLYGKPGSGKTEYAKALAKASGLKPLIFKNEAEISKNTRGNENVTCRLNLLLSIRRPDTVIIIDEADTLLKTRSYNFFGMSTPGANKGTVNKMLEECKNKIIWIVNFTSQIDESTLRRFNFSYKFESMSREQLRTITNSKLEPLSLNSEIRDEILGLMEKYSVTGASVDNVVKTIKSLEESENDSLLDCVQTILKENQLLINGKAKMRETVTESYDSRALNASMNPEEIVQMIKNAQAFAEKNHTRENGIRMLFYGLSGTGKTEFARYISEQLGKKILLKRASDILNKYVGGTEQNIKDAFEEAERTQSILLLDEADSFFADRNNAQRSWERTQVNELLTQMEEFSGILICTTNLRQIMDAAMNRRFHMIVEFKPLEKEGIRCMLQRYFSAWDFTEKQLERLERFSSITPGDFGVLAGRIRFMNPDQLSAEYITGELCKMQNEKDGTSGAGKIGFCA